MKFLVAFALAVACVHADVSHIVGKGDYDAVIVKSDAEVNPDGYNYVYETSNGIYGAARGVVKNVNSESPAQEVTGDFKYVSPDGVTYQVTYVADENGFQPKGDHLPVPPPVPEAILRSLAYIEAHPNQEAKSGPVQRVIQPVQRVAQPAQRVAQSPFAQSFASAKFGR